jgi:hypothetical protein
MDTNLILTIDRMRGKKRTTLGVFVCEMPAWIAKATPTRIVWKQRNFLG